MRNMTTWIEPIDKKLTGLKFAAIRKVKPRFGFLLGTTGYLHSAGNTADDILEAWEQLWLDALPNNTNDP